MSRAPRQLAVIGAGASGLAAAVELERLAADASEPISLRLFEASERPGGKVFTSDFSDGPVDLGAESLLGRGAEVEEQIQVLGLGPEAVRPATTSAAIWNGRRLVAIPKDSVLGIPLHPWRPDVVRAVGLLGAARAALEPRLPRGPADPDGALGPFLSDRVGKAVFRRLVDALVGGIYAGPAASLSSGAVAPQLLGAVQDRSSLLQGLRRAAAPSLGPSPFLSFRGGLGQLIQAMGARLPESSLELGRPVSRLQALPNGGVQVHAPGGPPADFSGAILAVPAPAAATLLEPVDARLATLLRHLEYASVGTITLAYPEDALPRPLSGSGFLVLPRPRRTVTACTFLDHKWPVLGRPGRILLRASVGSFGDEWALALDDTTLVASVHRELRRILGLLRLPVEARVERWHGALPQYQVGHLAWKAQVAEAAARLPLTAELTGAAYNGVGVATCLREGAASAGRLWERLRSR
ncbi:MAG: protoporphyrinogen oxidase [Candidatus Dormibacteria bacterium]